MTSRSLEENIRRARSFTMHGSLCQQDVHAYGKGSDVISV